MRSRDTTPQGRLAASTISVRLLRQISDKGRDIAQELQDAAGTDPAAAREAVTRAHALAAEIDALVVELAGATMLAGKTAAEVRSVTGIGTATLTRRVPKTLAALRGHVVERDAAAPHGYRVAD
ncbi:hypothetical protein [Mycobacterium aquaticum]|uniref:Uncharacterized protein n=1 Tax=Mycobacterium aquaticum TaxID=1927124 RepID=A0A1X0ABC7_9MYCO|nr:hypothetical protein [Mycobacterium aquaticum]ORA27370.1 hypothetical protein BST13_30390 [Mycobacterium aquaticum]